jgi:type I restriction enzyme S subunit
MSELNNIPKHWQVKKLGEVCKLKNGFAFKSTEYQKEGVPVIRISDINQGIVSGEDAIKVQAQDVYENYLVENNDILVAMSGATTGKFGIYKSTEKAYQNQRVGKFKILDEKVLNNQFLFHQINSLKRQIEKDAYGGAQPNISSNKIEQMEIVLPPLPEQLTIVSKIEELLSDLENGKQQLLTAQQQLKVYRQSLLKAAFEGKLTSTSLSEQKEGDLPEGWKLVTIGDLFEVYIGSTPKRNVPEYWGGNINWLSSGEIAFCSITKTKETISIAGLKNSSCKVHPIGTVIIAMIGEGKTRGQVAVLKIESSHNQNTAAIRVDNKIYKSELLYHYLVLKYEENRRVGSGNNQKALNKERVKSISIPLPPISEQQLIVDELESKLTVCDKIEETISQSLLQAETLKQSILKKAFEGKLA